VNNLTVFVQLEKNNLVSHRIDINEYSERYTLLTARHNQANTSCACNIRSYITL